MVSAGSAFTGQLAVTAVLMMGGIVWQAKITVLPEESSSEITCRFPSSFAFPHWCVFVLAKGGDLQPFRSNML